eukprot:TRINITY_DN1851_c0_g1_i2.p1 TRINITY_DN1851_c0_g1~~TRINITY_DN1851_c0_g1_i2.p1  ORF type:complete len:298 (+),score=35.84 TRINITY_DN1851_c0_g1_i2:21-914(+)
MSTAGQHLGNPQDANFPHDAEGRVYHLGVRKGEVANRILSVGDAGRAAMLSKMLDDPDNLFIASNRGFTVYTGTYKKTPLTIIATGMGTPMIDFVVRESRAVVDGPMAIVRFGTCGTPQTHIPIGTIMVADQSVLIRRNVDHWINESGSPYDISRPVPAHPALTEAVFSQLNDARTPYGVQRGSNATADSFYSSQGRQDPHFDDRNASLIDDLLVAHPGTTSLEMETFKLLHLAHCSRGVVAAAAATIVLAQRRSGAFLSNDDKHVLERLCGQACMDALVSYPLESTMQGDTCVWNR